MTEDIWVSSKKALRKATTAGFSEGDLRHWAELGKLRSRARKGRFSLDEIGDERLLELPETEPEREKEIQNRSDVGLPWPDIPTDFWYHLNMNTPGSEKNWGAGVFAATVYIETPCGPREESEHIKLIDVTFNDGDLALLINKSNLESVRATLPSHAKPNDRKYEERAHLAAEIVRRDGVTKSKAFSLVISEQPDGITTTESSQLSALRKAYDLMYDVSGFPIKKDQN